MAKEKKKNAQMVTCTNGFSTRPSTTQVQRGAHYTAHCTLHTHKERTGHINQAHYKITSFDMINAQSELMTKAQALMKQKDDLDAEIKSLEDNLKAVNFFVISAS
jgi:hypothetical protein